MKLTKKSLLLAGLALVGAGAIIYAFQPRPVRAELAVAQRGPLQVTVNEDGKTRIKERYVVSAPLAGRIRRVDLEVGDAVEAGQTCLTILEPTEPALLDPRARAQAAARVRAAEATRQQAVPLLERARTAHDFALSEWHRVKTLWDEKTISLQELENAEQKERTTAEELKSAQFAVQIADYELELAKAALLRTSPETDSPGDADQWQMDILSPIAGRVLRIFQEDATVVAAGARLLELGDPADLEVEVDVLSNDGVRIKPGAKVFFEHWGGDEDLPGRVRLVEPAAFTKISALGVEEQRVNVIIDFTGPPERRQGVGDAFRVDARIVVWEGNDVLKIPTGALFRHQDQWAVYRLHDGRAERILVTIGHRNDLEAEIINGLQAQDQIVVHPSDRISDGVKVEPL